MFGFKDHKKPSIYVKLDLLSLNIQGSVERLVDLKQL